MHHRGGRAPNEYESAIQAIGSILAPYDTDNQIPVWGFGGKVNNRVRHCFPLTFNEQQTHVQGVAGLLNAYRQSFRNVLLSGPTYFSEILTTLSRLQEVFRLRKRNKIIMCS